MNGLFSTNMKKIKSDNTCYIMKHFVGWNRDFQQQNISLCLALHEWSFFMCDTRKLINFTVVFPWGTIYWRFWKLPIIQGEKWMIAKYYLLFFIVVF